MHTQHDGDLTYVPGWLKRIVRPLTSPLWILFSKLSHQPALLFLRDPYLLPSAHGEFRGHISNQQLRPPLLFHLETSFLICRHVLECRDRRCGARSFLPRSSSEVEERGRRSCLQVSALYFHTIVGVRVTNNVTQNEELCSCF